MSNLMDGPLSFKLSDDEKIQKIKELKEDGNQAHRAGNYKRAARIYYNSIMYIKALSIYNADILGAGFLGGSNNLSSDHSTSGGKKKDLDPGTKTLICDCYNNLSACMLKDQQPKYERVIEYCDKALEMSPLNSKALFRKGISLYSLGQFEEGLQTLQKILSNDVQVTKYMELCKTEIRRQDKELASKFKDMFKSR